MNARLFPCLAMLLCFTGCGARLLRHEPTFTAQVLYTGNLCLGGISALGGGAFAGEKELENEVLRQFREYWTNLTVLPIQTVEECTGADLRKQLMKTFGENGSIELRDLHSFRPCADRSRFLLLLNLEEMFERNTETSREERTKVFDSVMTDTVWERSTSQSMRLRAVIYDLKNESLVWEATARAGSSNSESSSSYSSLSWPGRPAVTTSFSGALFQLQHRLSRDLAGPRIPSIVVIRLVQ
jgi:hypothetical protein